MQNSVVDTVGGGIVFVKRSLSIEHSMNSPSYRAIAYLLILVREQDTEKPIIEEQHFSYIDNYL